MLRIVSNDEDGVAPPVDPMLLMAEVDHRVANSLALISGLVRIRANAAEGAADMSGPAAARAFNEIAGQIESVARLSRLLSRRPGDELINVCEHLRDVCAVLSATVAHTSMSVRSSFDMECLLPQERVLPISLIVNEVVTNAAKYAHPTGVSGDIRVTCARALDGRLCVTITDDGVGFPEGFDPLRSTGLGFRVIRALVRQLGARHHFETSPMGVTFRLDLPV